MKKFFRFFSVFFLVLAVCTGAFFLWAHDRYVVPVMMYHHVAESDTSSGLHVSPQAFRQHMDFLEKNKYRVISLDEFVAGLKVRKKFPHNTVVITFDDGYKDNYIHAFPVLKEKGFPAVIFVSLGQIGQEGYLTWDQIEEMRDADISIGSHTLEHVYLPPLAASERIKQIRHSKAGLEKKLKTSVDYFAYPGGGFDEQIKEIVQKTGYRAAFTTNRGYDRYNTDIYELKRIKFSNNDQPDFVLRAKLSGFYNLFRKLKNPS